jgi:hypothetical protein
MVKNRAAPVRLCAIRLYLARQLNLYPLMLHRAGLFFGVWLGLLAGARAQSVPASTPVSALNFLQGRWQGTFSGGPIEAYWMPAAGNNLLGSIRMMKEDRATMYEILVVEQTEQGPTLLVKHFRPGLVGQEEKDVSDRYRLLEIGKERALFEKVDGSVRVIWERRPGAVLAVQRGTPSGGQWAFSDLFVFKSVR